MCRLRTPAASARGGALGRGYSLHMTHQARLTIVLTVDIQGHAEVRMIPAKPGAPINLNDADNAMMVFRRRLDAAWADLLEREKNAPPKLIEEPAKPTIVVP